MHKHKYWHLKKNKIQVNYYEIDLHYIVELILVHIVIFNIGYSYTKTLRHYGKLISELNESVRLLVIIIRSDIQDSFYDYNKSDFDRSNGLI